MQGPELQEVGRWTEIRVFVSSTFVDTHAERDILMKHVIPNINRKLSKRFIRIIPVDLRWGVLAEESKDCKAIQKTCLNQIDKCRRSTTKTPWFIGIRTQRYGWIQDELMPSHCFENPEFYSWIDTWEKHTSITSLECMHAAQFPKEMLQYPTVFFYQRELENPEDIEDDLKWLFEFEYLPPDTNLNPKLRYQYVMTEEAQSYKADQDNLNRVLQNLPHTKYSKYKCHYNKGRARYTCKRENAKSFGVAFVDGLEEFENEIEADLLKAVEMNFQIPVAEEEYPFRLKSIQHENSIKEKASIFVGRSLLLETGLAHCCNKSSDYDHNVMIIHGDPGCGKSGLLSAISQRCLSELPKDGDFVFTHLVDSCPGSNKLENMLIRLQLSLRDFRINQGEDELPLEYSTNINELRKDHHLLLEESASKYPEKLFVVIVDAVNQFHEPLQAWTMWWLPRQSCPRNVRFMITTLNNENNTFENACKASHNAVCVPVKEMSDEDLQEMVTAVLARFNKKLTVTDDPLLGNQMKLLLSKNKLPLYITAACEALRKFGIFEGVSKYIAKLPTRVVDLFSFLMDEWCEDYGKEIIEDITGFLYVSKDGLLENEINDILRFKENEIKGPDGLLYQSSFSRLYDSICSFFSSGGGGFLRFFHDQLKFAVKRKHVENDEIQRKFHHWLALFYQSVIGKQTQLKPTAEPCAYYEHALQQIVYHQLQSTPPGEPLSILMHTLRNIYFVRERVLNNQTYDLNQEYMDAIQRSCKQDEILALREWAKFVQFYEHAICEFPEYCCNMAVNLSVSAPVRCDTEQLEPPECNSPYPFKWINSPDMSDPKLVTYSYGGTEWNTIINDCVASTPEGDICCSVDGEKAVVFDQSSGEILHEMEVDGYSLALSANFETVWIGHGSGHLSLWDVKTGTLVTQLEDQLNDCVVWLELVDNILVCGTGFWKEKLLNCLQYEGISDIAIFDVEKKSILKQWSTGSPGCCFCYHKVQKLIFSGHRGFIQGWDLDGDLQLTLSDAGQCVLSLSPHPFKELLLSGSVDSIIRQWSVTNKMLSFSFLDSTEDDWDYAGNLSVQYDAVGERVLCTETFGCSLRIYTLNGVLQEELQGHLGHIKKISLVPGSDLVLSGNNGGQLILWKLPPLDLNNVKEGTHVKETIKWCEFMPNGKGYLTLSNDYLRIWDVSNHTMTNSIKLDRARNLRSLLVGAQSMLYFGIFGALHPSGQYVCIGTKMTATWFKLPELRLTHSFKALDEQTVSDSVEEKDNECHIFGMKISPDGSKLLILEFRKHNPSDGGALVFDINDIKKPITNLIYRGHVEHGGCILMYCDIHPDNIRAITTGFGLTVVWSIITGETFLHIKHCGNTLVKFFHKTNRFFFDEKWTLGIRELAEESDIVHLPVQKNHLGKKVACLYHNESMMVTGSPDGEIRVFDAISGECLYSFFHSQALTYTAIAIHPSDDLIIAANQNGLVYALKPVQKFIQ